MENVLQLYKAWKGCLPQSAAQLPGAGSNRKYYRLTDAEGGTVVGVSGTSREENEAFIRLARHFGSRGLPVSRVLAVSQDNMCYLQTDLGNRSLYDALAEGRRKGGAYSETEKELLRRTMAVLPRIQYEGAEGLDFACCYPLPEMDRQAVFFDLNYFKYCFLKTTGLDFHEGRLEADFRAMADELAVQPGMNTFLYRDFQARNVMLDGSGAPYLIDFQGGRRGPVEYDVASFLWQASAHYSPELREELVDVYLEAARPYRQTDGAAFRKRLKLFVLFRTMQVLGAYGFRGYFERKSYFLESIPAAIGNLRALLAEEACPYPYLHSLLAGLVEQSRSATEKTSEAGRASSRPEQVEKTGTLPAGDRPGTASSAPSDGEHAPLVVSVFSFSYRKGIPEDESGNGGGYVFDCRGVHNPGRYERYRTLTGLDEPVIRFLEEDGEILRFLESVYRLADAHVERYLERGFTSLMFSFGCTGGQHRSVYSAQHLAQHLHDKYGVEVRLFHREQNIREAWPRS